MDSHHPAIEAFLSHHGGAASILDLGCGDGGRTAGLPATVRVVGLDRSPLHIAQARAARPAGEYRVHDLEAPVPPDLGAFDLLLAVGCFDAGVDAARALGHLAAVARAGARLLVTFRDGGVADLDALDDAFASTGWDVISTTFGPGDADDARYSLWEADRP